MVSATLLHFHIKLICFSFEAQENFLSISGVKTISLLSQITRLFFNCYQGLLLKTFD